MKTELQIAAGKLIREIFGVKPGETVTITTDYDSDMVVTRAVADAAQEAGAIPMIIQFPTPRSVGKAADPDLPIETLTAALSATDVWIEFNHQWLLYSTPFERASQQNFVPVVDDKGAFIGIVTRKAIIKYCQQRLFPEE